MRQIVAAAIAEIGATDKKMTGRVMGVVMKGHKGLVDARVVKQMIEEALG